MESASDAAPSPSPPVIENRDSSSDDPSANVSPRIAPSHIAAGSRKSPLSIFASSPTAAVARPVFLDPETRPRSSGSVMVAPAILFASQDEDEDESEVVNITETPLVSSSSAGLSVAGLGASRPRSPSVFVAADAKPQSAGLSAPSSQVQSGLTVSSPIAGPSPPPVSAAAASSHPHYGTMPRFGFSPSHLPHIAAAESSFHRQIAMQQLAASEQQWGPALRGVQMLAHAVPAEILPLRRLARKFGIPPHIRGIMWLTFTGVAQRVEENDGFCAALLDAFGSPGGETAHCIEKDLERTFPDHPLFAPNQPGNLRLRRVLHALSWRNPLIGYCQGFNFMAGLLLLFLDDEEAVFWTMCYILERYLPNDYYASNLVGIRADQLVLVDMVRTHLPKIANHFDRLQFDAGILVPTWLMSLFVGVVPVSGLVPIWDYLLSREPSVEASAAPMAVCLALLRVHQESILAAGDGGELLVKLTNLVQCTCNGLAVVKIANDFKLTEEAVRVARRKHRTRLAHEAAQRQAELRRVQSAARVTLQSRHSKGAEASQAAVAEPITDRTLVASPSQTRRLPGSRARDSFGASPLRGNDGTLAVGTAQGSGAEIATVDGSDRESSDAGEEMGEVR